jgi:hypothetical protein
MCKKGRVIVDFALENGRRKREKLDIMPLPYGDASFALKFTKNLRLKFLSEL